MIFAPSIITNTTPQVSVQVADGGNPAVTYAQVKQSLGNQVYKVDTLNIFANTISQLIGAIQYNRYDAVGNREIHSIVTTVDPYQATTSIFTDLTKYKNDVILNGNSTLQANILPNAFVLVTFYCRRITNSFGLNKFNFSELEEIFRKDFYTKKYSDFETEGRLILLEDEKSNFTNFTSNEDTNKVDDVDKKSLAMLSLASFSFLFYLIYKK
jgi:hypothetical protein